MKEIDLSLLGNDHLARIMAGVGIADGYRSYCIITFDSADEMADFVEAYREAVDPLLAGYWDREYVFREAYDCVHALKCAKIDHELWFTDDYEVDEMRKLSNYFHVVACRDLYISIEEFEESNIDIASLFN